MGMDSQAGGLLEKGLDMARGHLGRESGDDDRLAEAREGLAGQDAAEDASLARRKARRDGAEYRDRAEQERAGTHAIWGASNLAMSGSKALVRDAERQQDRQLEEDILFEGDQEAQRRLNQATRLRSGGGTAHRSTLALGSKLYKYGG